MANHPSLQPFGTLLLAVAVLAACRAGAPALEAASPPARPNVLLLLVDDLRPELASFGADYVHSPNIDGLVDAGRAFTRHYVQAPTCGASRYALLTGRYARGDAGHGNNALVKRAQDLANAAPSLPDVFRAAGYTTVALGKVSHHPGGYYGKGWNDPSKPEMPGAWTRQAMPVDAAGTNGGGASWGTPQGAMHGLANGHVRAAGVTPAIESFDGPDTAYPDGLTVERALAELEQLAADDAPFLLAVGLIRPHLPFGAPARYMASYADVELPPVPHPTKPAGRTTWHASGEFFGQYHHAGRDPRTDADYADAVRRHYAACVTYADALVGRVLARLDELELADDTIVVLWGDHGWHLGEHAVWGKHTLFEESLRSPLVLRIPGAPAPGARSDAVAETVDVFPTLCDLAGVPPPAGLDGRSLRPQLDDPDVGGRPAIAYKTGAETIRTERWRLVRHTRDGTTTHVELYDHASPAGETVNVAADEPEVVAELLQALAARLRDG